MYADVLIQFVFIFLIFITKYVYILHINDYKIYYLYMHMNATHNTLT